jgi:hypothetical protein
MRTTTQTAITLIHPSAFSTITTLTTQQLNNQPLFTTSIALSNTNTIIIKSKVLMVLDINHH